MATVGALDYDPFAPGVIADPYPWYRRLLGEAAPHYVPGRDLWVLSRYEHVRDAARDHTALSSADGITYVRIPLPMMITIDPPDHTRLRKLVSPVFTRRRIQQWRPAIERVTAPLVDDLVASATGGAGDGVTQLAGPLPVTTIAEMLGIPSGDRAMFRDWADRAVEGFDLLDDVYRADEVDTRILDAVNDLHGYFTAAIEERRRGPSDDLITRLLHSSEGDELTAEELFWFCFLLLLAGTETTTNLLGTLLHQLATQPDLWRRLAADPSRVPDAVEEALRWGSPIQGFFRTATEPFEAGGVRIPAGGRVLLLFGAANRDPRQFPDPDLFDLDRRPTQHLAFGSGIHFCLGAHLARLQTTVAVEYLLRRGVPPALAGEPVRTGNPTLRGFTSLPLATV